MFTYRGFFLQYLEGEGDAVGGLFNTIRSDIRHSKITLLSCHTIERRNFFDWGMSLVTKLETHRQLLRELNHAESFYLFQFKKWRGPGIFNST